MVSRPPPFPGTESWFTDVPWIRDADLQDHQVFVVMSGEPATCWRQVAYSSRQSAEVHLTRTGDDSLFVLPVELTV